MKKKQQHSVFRELPSDISKPAIRPLSLTGLRVGDGAKELFLSADEK